MSDVDELDVNPFFRALQTTYQDLYEKAQDSCNVVCVPQTSSLVDVPISKKLIETHILKPSPYFRSQFITSVSPNKIVELDENGKEFKTIDGFSSSHTVKIINEEQGYNKEYKPYKILILEYPVDPDVKPRRSKEKRQDVDNSSLSIITLSECCNFLRSYAEYGRTLNCLDENIKKFNANYMVLKDYLEEAQQKLESISTEAAENCKKCTRHELWLDPKFKDAINYSMESYVMGGVHQKIFPIVCDRFEADDMLLFDKCKQLHDVTPEQLGVDTKFSCPLPTAVVELANLDGLKTPLEKLHCLKSTVDNATNSIQSFMEENRVPPISPTVIEDSCRLTSDDLIPILVTVIAQAKSSHLASNIYYIETFHWAADTKDMNNLSYCLVTFKAAVEYMKHTKFDGLQRKLSMKREISIDELMKVTRGATQPEGIGSEINGATNTVSGSSRLDRQLEKISQMLAESSREWCNANSSTKNYKHESIFGEQYKVQRNPDVTPPLSSQIKQQQLGDFLTSLQDDPFGCSFGKQS